MSQVSVAEVKEKSKTLQSIPEGKSVTTVVAESKATFKPFSRSVMHATPTHEEFREMTEEGRLRFLKAIKISVWRQFEKGVLGEEPVQTLISAVEDVEDQELAMVHVLDMKSHWKVSGFTPKLREILSGLTKETFEEIPPPPKQRYYRSFRTQKESTGHL